MVKAQWTYRYLLIMGLGSSHGWAYSIVFSGKTLSLHPGVQMGTGHLNGRVGEDRNRYIIPLIGGPNDLKQLDLCTCINNRLYIFSLPTGTLFIFSTLLSPNPPILWGTANTGKCKTFCRHVTWCTATKKFFTSIRFSTDNMCAAPYKMLIEKKDMNLSCSLQWIQDQNDLSLVQFVLGFS